MTISLPKGFFWDHELKMGPETSALSARVWPNYLVEESDMPEPGLKFKINPKEFARRFPVWGIRRENSKELVAFAQAVLLHIDPAEETLPNEGWSYAIRAAGTPEERNCLCLLMANVDPTARGLGLSQILINRAKLEAVRLGFRLMIAPVRPTLKHKQPFTAMNEFLQKRTEAGAPFDPWIRLHQLSGAKITNVCENSVCIQASLKKWRQWTGLPLLTEGERVLPQGLVPLKVDLENNVGVYREPNVWMRYDL